MREITDRQNEILQGIIDYSLTNNRYPTVRNIADMFGLSLKSIQDHVEALVKKGALVESKGRSGIVAKGLKIAKG